ncbi:MAG: WD40/YVTN/BNR-like repeat-containing protein, partial [bacterium]
MKCKISKISVRRWHTFFSILSLVALHAISAFAQGQRIPERSIDIQEILNQYDEYFSSRTDEQNSARGSGFKPFKRWEWFVTPRAFPGASLNTGARWNAFQDILAVRAQNPQPTLGADWTSIGPSNIAGRMLDIALDPNDPDIIWAGSASGGIWKSPDAGSSWIAMDDQLPTLAIGCVVTHNTNSDIVYIGTGEGMFNADAVSGVGVLKTTDGGSTWSQTGLIWQLSDNAAVNEMVMHPNNSAILIAATRDGVYRTTDSGANWTQTLAFSGPEDAKEVVIDPVDPNNVYAALGYPWGHANNGIYKSTDNGVTWSKLSNGLPTNFSNVGRTSLAIHDNNPAILYAGISGSFSFNGSGLIGVYKTTDGGSSWTLQATSPNFYSSQGWYDNIIAVDPVDPDIVYSGGVGLYKSTNSGITWANIGTSIHVDQHAFMFHPNDHNTIIAGNDGGMYKSFNAGSTWLDINDGLTTMQFYAMGSDANDANKAFGGTQDNGTNRHDGSLLWDHVMGGDGGECNVDYTNSNIVYAEYQLGYHRKSTNGGNSWFSINNGLAGNGPWVTPVEMDPIDPEILYTIASANLYRTTTGGTSWSLLFAAGALSSSIRAAASDNQTIYASGFGAIYRTTDGGATWTDITSGLSSVAITSIAVHPNDPQLLYVGMSGWSAGNHVFKSFDAGDTWQNVTNDLPNIPCNTLVLDPAFPDHVYVGTDLGVYLSTDGGGSWAGWNTGLANVVIDELDIHQASGVIRAATHGRGMYQSPLFVPTGFDVLIWIHSDVTDPNVAEKASRRGLTTEEVEAMVAAPTSHTALAAALAANGKTVLTVSDITSVTLSDFEAVFAVVGIFPNNHVIPAGGAEATAIVNYINAGGSMYMEGGDMWAYDPVSAGGHDFGPLFGINGLSDGAGDLSTVLGVTGTFTEGLDYTYSGDNNFIDRIEPTSTGFTVHENSSPPYDCGIANSTSGYHTIGNAFQFGGLDDVVTNQTKQELMAAYLNFFGTPTAGPPDIEVSPASFSFTLPEGGTDSDVLTISNVAAAGADDLNWNITEEEVILALSNGQQASLMLRNRYSMSVDEAISSIIERSGILRNSIVVSNAQTAEGSGNHPDQVEFTTPEHVANAKYNSNPGPSATDVAVLGAPGLPSWNDEVQAKLLNTGLFSSVSVINVQAVTPTLPELQAFKAVLVYSDDGFNDPVLFGNVLADYVDSGGGVVCAVFAVASVPLGGRFDTDNYWAIAPSSQTQGTREFLGTIFDPGHPILNGVSSFDGGSSSYRQSTFDVAAGATRIADWTDGRALIATKVIGGTDRVDLGFYPPSSDSRSDFWEAVTDGAELMANALIFVSGGAGCPWLSETPTSGTIAGGGSENVDILVDATGLAIGAYDCNLLVNSNDPDEPQVVVPVQLNVVPEAADALIWIPEDVIEPDLARK